MNLNGINQFNIQEYSKSDSFTAEEKQEIKTSIFEYKDSIEDNYSDNDINKKLQKIIEEFISEKEKLEEKETDDKDIKSLSEEEIQNMTTEELIEVFRGDMWELIEPGNISHINQNEILFNLVSKMTYEQLDDFMKTYKEKYPRSNNDGTIDLFSFEALENDVMWGSYCVSAGKISQEELNSTMERLKKYFPKLGAETNAYIQWA